MEIFNTDVLVVGGGGAGSRAALSSKLFNPKLNVVLATVGRYGTGGSTNFFASEILGINAPFNFKNDGDNPEVYKTDMVETGLGLADEKLCEIVSKEAVSRVNDLINLGVKFDSFNDIIKQTRLSGCTKARSLSVDGKTGFEIVRALRNENYRNGVKVIENCRLVQIIVDEGIAYGGMFIIDKKPILINAKAIILATGGGGGIFHLNVNPTDVQGDGYAVALKAGAKLINMEFIQIGPAIVYPAIKFIVHSYIWSFLPRLLNIKNEEFLLKYLPYGLNPTDVLSAKRFSFPFSCRSIAKYIDIAMFKEIISGNGTRNGGIFLDISHVHIGEVRNKASTIYNILKKRGFNISDQSLEIAPMVQSFNGGIVINENGETCIEGLFAAGEVSGGVHGADRPGGNNLTICQVFGHRAGIAASIFAHRRKINNRSFNLKARGTEKSVAFDEKDYGSSLSRLKKLFSRHLSVVRDRDGLNIVLNATEDIIQRGHNGNISVISPLYYTAIIGNAIAKSALLREESRGTHYREDFPNEDSNFKKRIILKLKGDEVFAEFEK